MKFHRIATILGLTAVVFQAVAATNSDPRLASAIIHECSVMKATLDSKPIIETYQYGRKRRIPTAMLSHKPA